MRGEGAGKILSPGPHSAYPVPAYPPPPQAYHAPVAPVHTEHLSYPGVATQPVLSSSVQRETSAIPDEAQAGPSSAIQFVQHVPEQPTTTSGKHYEVVPCGYEEIMCHIRIKNKHTGIESACGAILSNSEKALANHFQAHKEVGNNPTSISACPFPKKKGTETCGSGKGNANFDAKSYARHMIAKHFEEKERFRCLQCRKTFARPDKLKKGHKCVPVERQGDGDGAAPSNTQAREDRVVGGGPMAGPPGFIGSFPELHDSRPRKRPRTAR